MKKIKVQKLEPKVFHYLVIAMSPTLYSEFGRIRSVDSDPEELNLTIGPILGARKFLTLT